MVEHAGTLRNLFHRSAEIKDGKTPNSRHRGCEWRVSFPPSGETTDFLKGSHKFESRWQQGVFLGVKGNTTEKIVGNASGVFTVQSIKRKSGEDRYNLETLQSVTGLPWQLEMKYQKYGWRTFRTPGTASSGSSTKAKDFEKALH